MGKHDKPAKPQPSPQPTPDPASSDGRYDGVSNPGDGKRKKGK